MRKILILNGSHKSDKSFTMKITESFLSGLSENTEDFEIETVHLADQNISACTGCFFCWRTTPGQCVIQDDMTELITKYEEADIIIWTTPLYHCGISSIMKKFMERTTPLLLPFIDPEGGGAYGRPFRNPEIMKNKKHVLISTCGLPTTKNNYEGVVAQFNNLFGEDKWEKILCIEGELLGISQLDNLTVHYLDLVRIAGKEYSEHLRIPDNIREGLSKPFIEIPTYLKTANLSWGVDDIRMRDLDGGLIAWSYMRQVQASFNPKVRPGLDAILQIDFTDLKERYQLIVKNDECTLLKNDFKDETASINLNLSTLERIFEGKIDAAQALIEKKYSVVGDMNLLNAFFDGLFGSVALNPERKKKVVPISFKNTPYWFFLTVVPWIVSLLFLDYSALFGIVIPLVICGILCTIKRGADLVYFEKGTLLLFSLFTLIFMTFGKNFDGNTFAIIEYFSLALIWLVSLLKTIPLSADYLHFFNGRNALRNALFLKTNRILTLVWSGIFVVQGGITIWLNTTFMTYLAAIFPLALLVPGVFFTMWFIEWYPEQSAKPE